MASRKNSAQARRYLESRGISPEIIKEFNLGFAHDSWDSLVKFASRNNIRIGELEELGLVIAKEGGSGALRPVSKQNYFSHKRDNRANLRFWRQNSERRRI